MENSNPTIIPLGLSKKSKKIRKPNPSGNRRGRRSKLEGEQLLFCFYYRVFRELHTQNAKIYKAVEEIMNLDQVDDSAGWKRAKKLLGRNYDVERREMYGTQDLHELTFEDRYELEMQRDPAFAEKINELHDSYVIFLERKTKRHPEERKKMNSPGTSEETRTESCSEPEWHFKKAGPGNSENFPLDQPLPFDFEKTPVLDLSRLEYQQSIEKELFAEGSLLSRLLLEYYPGGL
jgi:hypothetical protein